MSERATEIRAGATFPAMAVSGLDGNVEDIGKPVNGADWKMVVGYRGRHYPMCTQYLDTVVSGLQWIRSQGNNYPIRGTCL